MFSKKNATSEKMYKVVYYVNNNKTGGSKACYNKVLSESEYLAILRDWITYHVSEAHEIKSDSYN